jgi:hypothetical protein
MFLVKIHGYATVLATNLLEHPQYLPYLVQCDFSKLPYLESSLQDFSFWITWSLSEKYVTLLEQLSEDYSQYDKG